ncbi:MAG: glycosyltransferase [Pseudomonadota bacterium]
MNAKPRILHISNTLNTGGAQRSLYSLLLGGLTKETDSHVISMTDLGSFGAKIKALDIPVHTLDMEIGKPTIAGARKLRAHMRDIRPDIIQGWMYHGNIAATFGRIVSPGKPALAWNIRHSVHDLSVERRSTRFAIKVNRMLSGRADSIIYNSIMARQQHEGLGYARSTGSVIPNGFDLGVWKPDDEASSKVRHQLGIGEKGKIVGMVARYHPMKNINSFLQAMRPLMDENSDLHCLLCGEDLGPGNQALAADLQALPQDRLHSLGLRSDLPEIYPALDILCLSSAWGEGFPNVLGEAMACGVPCVATDVGDSRHVIGDVGLVVPVSDTQALSAALREMVMQPHEALKELSTKARKRIEANYPIEGTINTYIEHYQDLHNRQR